MRRNVHVDGYTGVKLPSRSGGVDRGRDNDILDSLHGARLPDELALVVAAISGAFV
jgi:hypothetical protein